MGLSVQGVSKTFGDRKAVDSISFSIDEPGVFGLIGTNGAGKTTTIRMILGVLSRDEGEITWNGGPLNRETVRFGYMPEERGIYPKVKVLEQLVYFGELRGMTAKQGVGVGRPLAGKAGHHRIPGLSRRKALQRQQQKVQLIATILHDPELIFLDEPFSGLDPINTDVFKSVIGELIAAGKTIVMSSHQMATVEEYCRDLVLLNRGKNGFCKAISAKSRRAMGIPICPSSAGGCAAHSPRHMACACSKKQRKAGNLGSKETFRPRPFSKNW